jgi:hypothetical protein
MPGDSGVTCMLVCALPLPLHTRPRAHRPPGIPCALNSERAGNRSKIRGACAGEIAKVCLNCRHPRKRVIQYSRDASDRIEKPRRTGSPRSSRATTAGMWGAHSRDPLAPNDCVKRDREVVHDQLPSLHAPLRVAGRGRGWGVPQQTRCQRSKLLVQPE